MDTTTNEDSVSHQTGRTIYDADNHVIESRGWLESYATDCVYKKIEEDIFDLDLGK